MDSRLARIKELIEQKEAIDSELESLIAGESVKIRKTKTCSSCGTEGHTARTCPKKVGATAAAESTDKGTT
jgi:Zinc knuckle